MGEGHSPTGTRRHPNKLKGHQSGTLAPILLQRRTELEQPRTRPLHRPIPRCLHRHRRRPTTTRPQRLDPLHHRRTTSNMAHNTQENIHLTTPKRPQHLGNEPAEARKTRALRAQRAERPDNPPTPTQKRAPPEPTNKPRRRPNAEVQTTRHTNPPQKSRTSSGMLKLK